MTSAFRQIKLWVAVCAVTTMTVVASAQARSEESPGSAVLRGEVRDPSGRPLVNATVSLRLAGVDQNQATHTDSEGVYRFMLVREGVYTLCAEMKDYRGVTVSSVRITNTETKQVDLILVPTPPSTMPVKPDSQTPEFFDEPQFSVAGVTHGTNSGGHGSDTVLRTTEALAKATVSLGKESSSDSAPPAAATESGLREALARNPKDPALHHQLGDVEEKTGKPLEAVREYQRAAELDSSEWNLFDWGAELLTHRALEPATEVFAKGNRLFPKSVRMLVALGVAWYARGSYDRATHYLVDASDLAPDDSTPYLFLGEMLTVETVPPEGSVERLARFAQLQPANALAIYYYAVGLDKQSAGVAEVNTDRSAHVESLLQKAVGLDPKLGAAYLQLGILYSRRADFSQAIFAYRRSIEVSTDRDETLAEAHYRLAQAYLRTGDKTRAQQELKLHSKVVMKTKEDTARQRSSIQGFVISLRNKDSGSPKQP